jgi:hypothetical protein
MKAYKTFLHFWITIASLLSFLGGWVLLAHSKKPLQPIQSGQTAAVDIAPLPTLPPIQFFNGGAFSDTNNFTVNNNPAPVSRAPLLMTGGS